MVRYEHKMSLSQDKCHPEHKPMEKSPKQSPTSFEWSMDSDFSFHNSTPTTDYDFPYADDLFREGKILPIDVKKEIPIPFQPFCALLHKIVKNDRTQRSEAKLNKIEQQKKDKDWETQNTATSSKQSQVLQQFADMSPRRALCNYNNSIGANTNSRHKEEKKLQRKTKTASRNEEGIHEKHSRPLHEFLEAVQINTDSTQQEPQRKTKTAPRNEEGIREKKVNEACWQHKRSTSLHVSSLDHKAGPCPRIRRWSMNSNQLTTCRDGQKHLQKLKPSRNSATPSHKRAVDPACLEKKQMCHGVGTLTPYGHPVVVPLVDSICQSSNCFSCKNNRNKK